MLFHTWGWVQNSSLSSGDTKSCCSFAATATYYSPKAVFSPRGPICQIRQEIIVAHTTEVRGLVKVEKWHRFSDLFPNQMLQIVLPLDAEILKWDGTFTGTEVPRKLIQLLPGLQQPFHLRSCNGVGTLWVGSLSHLPLGIFSLSISS